MIKNILLVTSFLIVFSCSSNSLSSENNEETAEKVNSSEQQYIQLQVKMHQVYTLLKAFNAGAISQEEYDKLKKELI